MVKENAAKVEQIAQLSNQQFSLSTEMDQLRLELGNRTSELDRVQQELTHLRGSNQTLEFDIQAKLGDIADLKNQLQRLL